jgi:hypothetical protein
VHLNTPANKRDHLHHVDASTPLTLNATPLVVKTHGSSTTHAMSASRHLPGTTSCEHRHNEISLVLLIWLISHARFVWLTTGCSRQTKLVFAAQPQPSHYVKVNMPWRGTARQRSASKETRGGSIEVDKRLCTTSCTGLIG